MDQKNKAKTIRSFLFALDGQSNEIFNTQLVFQENFWIVSVISALFSNKAHKSF